jgi:hypothetical protein
MSTTSTAPTPQADQARYPIGKFRRPQSLTAAERAEAISTIEAMPQKLAAAVKGWSDAQLDTPYREGGWTVRQLIHHVADSHMQAFTRIRFALTEDTPTIKPYEEKDWAKLADSQSMPVDASLRLLQSLHERWVFMLRALKDDQWQRVYRHPESGDTRVDHATALYAWHSNHHLAHITRLAAQQGWQK